MSVQDQEDQQGRVGPFVTLASPSAPGAWARYATATGERTVIFTGDPAVPA